MESANGSAKKSPELPTGHALLWAILVGSACLTLAGYLIAAGEAGPLWQPASGRFYIAWRLLYTMLIGALYAMALFLVRTSHPDAGLGLLVGAGVAGVAKVLLDIHKEVVSPGGMIPPDFMIPFLCVISVPYMVMTGAAAIAFVKMKRVKSSGPKFAFACAASLFVRGTVLWLSGRI